MEIEITVSHLGVTRYREYIIMVLLIDCRTTFTMNGSCIGK